MSTSFIYGGIDRNHVLWTQHSDPIPGSTEVTNETSELSAITQRQHSANSGFIYGGLDRKPVKWLGLGFSSEN